MRREPRYDKEEYTRRGNEMYRRVVRPHMRPEDKGKLVAVDIETGAFELGDNQRVSDDRLLELNPDAQIWVIRVGYKAVRSFGGQPLPEEDP